MSRRAPCSSGPDQATHSRPPTSGSRACTCSTTSSTNAWQWRTVRPRSRRRRVQTQPASGPACSSAGRWAAWGRSTKGSGGWTFPLPRRWDPGQGLKVMGPVEPNIEIQDLVLQLKMAARLSLDAGDMAGALAHAMTIQARPDWGMLFENRELGDTAVEVLIAAGRLKEAEEVVARARAEDTWAQEFQDRMEGRLALAQGDFETARGRLAKAAVGFEAIDYGIEEMRTRRSLAEVHLKAGDAAAGEAELRSVVKKAEERGAVLQGDLARQKLAELGIHLEHSHAPQQPPQRAEERVVTVMFADVRGYTSMLKSEAPADMVDKVASFHRWAQQEA